MSRVLVVLLTLGLAFAAPAAAQESPPELGPFIDAELGEALGRDGLVVAFFSAASCQPCRVMHALTWSDRHLAAWMRANTTAVEVDVDAFPWAATAYGVEGTPQLVAFRGGDELGRLVGMSLPDQVLEFLAAMRDGRSYPPPAETEEDLVALAEEDCSQLVTRAMYAQMLGRLDECQRIASFCWRRALEFEPALVGVRGSFLVMTIGQLVRAHPPAREEFFGFLVELDVAVRRGAEDVDTWRDLFALADTLDEEARAVAAVRHRLDDRGVLPVSPELLDVAHEFLWRAGERELAGSIADDLGLHAEFTLLRLLERARARDSLTLSQAGAQTAGRYYGSALLAGQDDTAERIASLALQSFRHEQTRGLLVEGALVAGCPRPEHLEWLRIDAAQGSELVRYRAGLMERYVRRHLAGHPVPPFAPPWEPTARLERILR